MTAHSGDLTILFSGDSGNGMQLIGNLFTIHMALNGYDISGTPDYPAEIRAPAGSLNGISSYQCILSKKIAVSKDGLVNIFLAMNIAAFKKNIIKLKIGGILIFNSDNFTPEKLKKGNYDPLEFEESISRQYQVVKVSANKMAKELLSDIKIDYAKKMVKSNMIMLGLVYWLIGIPEEEIESTVNNMLKKRSEGSDINLKLLKAGYNYGIINDLSCNLIPNTPSLKIKESSSIMNGNEALALCFIKIAEHFKRPLFVAGYPITPASSFMDYITKHRQMNTQMVQAEDEIAAAGIALGAGYGGSIAVTCTSGPGLDLTMETLGLAVMTEIPMILINIQRSGPSTGMPTKTEQTDLLTVCFGRHGECPLPVFAISTIADIAHTVKKAITTALRYMTPVIILSDAFTANNIQECSDLQAITNANIEDERLDFLALSSKNLIPHNSKDMRKRISGLEVDDNTNEISCDANNHQRMTLYRANKINEIAEESEITLFHGQNDAKNIVISWGSNYSVLENVIDELNLSGYSICLLHLKLVYPLPDCVEKMLKGKNKVFVVELNLGQLSMIIRARYLVNAISIGKVDGSTFYSDDIKNQIIEELTHD